MIHSFDISTVVIKCSQIFDVSSVLCFTLDMNRSTYAKQQGTSCQATWCMWRREEFPAHQLLSGTVNVAMPTVSPAARSRRAGVYARVSPAENRKALDSQAERALEFCAARSQPVTTVATVVKECGSGVNDPRPQFLALLAERSLSHLVVEHKGSCSRVDVVYRQTVLTTHGSEVVIVNEAENGQEDLMADIVAIMTSFTSVCARLSGQRRVDCKQTQRLTALEAN